MGDYDKVLKSIVQRYEEREARQEYVGLNIYRLMDLVEEHIQEHKYIDTEDMAYNEDKYDAELVKYIDDIYDYLALDAARRQVLYKESHDHEHIFVVKHNMVLEFTLLMGQGSCVMVREVEDVPGFVLSHDFSEQRELNKRSIPEDILRMLEGD